ncbi:MAG TPA: hypothetical protein VF303_03200 [Candidatus Nanoarchaeia archaeon]
MSGVPALLEPKGAIGSRQAPEWVLRKAEFELSYHAIVRKRLGCINTGDFLRCARRLVALCNKVYRESTITLRRDKRVWQEEEPVPIGRTTVMVPQIQEDASSGEILDVGVLDESRFEEIFQTANRITLRVEPRSATGDFEFSFAEMEWSREKPKAIYFYAQGGRVRSLDAVLYRQMFYVPGMPPSLSFRVELGIEPEIREMHRR